MVLKELDLSCPDTASDPDHKEAIRGQHELGAIHLYSVVHPDVGSRQISADLTSSGFTSDESYSILLQVLNARQDPEARNIIERRFREQIESLSK